MRSSVVFLREREGRYILLKVYVATYNMAVFSVSRIVYIKELKIHLMRFCQAYYNTFENYCFYISIFDSIQFQ